MRLQPRKLFCHDCSIFHLPLIVLWKVVPEQLVNNDRFMPQIITGLHTRSILSNKRYLLPSWMELDALIDYELTEISELKEIYWSEDNWHMYHTLLQWEVIYPLYKMYVCIPHPITVRGDILYTRRMCTTPFYSERWYPLYKMYVYHTLLQWEVISSIQDVRMCTTPISQSTCLSCAHHIRYNSCIYQAQMLWLSGSHTARGDNVPASWAPCCHGWVSQLY